MVTPRERIELAIKRAGKALNELTNLGFTADNTETSQLINNGEIAKESKLTASRTNASQSPINNENQNSIFGNIRSQSQRRTSSRNAPSLNSNRTNTSTQNNTQGNYNNLVKEYLSSSWLTSPDRMKDVAEVTAMYNDLATATDRGSPRYLAVQQEFAKRHARGLGKDAEALKAMTALYDTNHMATGRDENNNRVDTIRDRTNGGKIIATMTYNADGMLRDLPKPNGNAAIKLKAIDATGNTVNGNGLEAHIIYGNDGKINQVYHSTPIYGSNGRHIEPGQLPNMTAAEVSQAFGSGKLFHINSKGEKFELPISTNQIKDIYAERDHSLGISKAASVSVSRNNNNLQFDITGSTPAIVEHTKDGKQTVQSNLSSVPPATIGAASRMPPVVKVNENNGVILGITIDGKPINERPTPGKPLIINIQPDGSFKVSQPVQQQWQNGQRQQTSQQNMIGTTRPNQQPVQPYKQETSVSSKNKLPSQPSASKKEDINKLVSILNTISSIKDRSKPLLNQVRDLNKQFAQNNTDPKIANILGNAHANYMGEIDKLEKQANAVDHFAKQHSEIANKEPYKSSIESYKQIIDKAKRDGHIEQVKFDLNITPEMNQERYSGRMAALLDQYSKQSDIHVEADKQQHKYQQELGESGRLGKDFSKEQEAKRQQLQVNQIEEKQLLTDIGNEIKGLASKHLKFEQVYESRKKLDDLIDKHLEAIEKNNVSSITVGSDGHKQKPTSSIKNQSQDNLSHVIDKLQANYEMQGDSNFHKKSSSNSLNNSGKNTPKSKGPSSAGPSRF